MAQNNSFLDYIWEAVPEAEDVGEWLGYTKWGARGTPTGLKPTGPYGFLDLAGDIGGDIYDVGKSIYKFGKDMVQSDTMKAIVAAYQKYRGKLKDEGTGDYALIEMLAKMAPAGRDKKRWPGQAPFIGFTPGGKRAAGPSGRPASWDMVDELMKNPRIMGNIKSELEGKGYGTNYDPSNVNLSASAALKAITVRNPWKTGLSGAKHKIDS